MHSQGSVFAVTLLDQFRDCGGFAVECSLQQLVGCSDRLHEIFPAAVLNRVNELLSYFAVWDPDFANACFTDSDKIAPSSPVIDMSGTAIACADSEICCFNTPHDTIQSCGYRIRTGDDKLCAVCTDLGHITQEVDEALNGCRLVLLESNYDESMLRSGPYPLYLKQRILSPNGHLSNDSCAAQVRSLIERGTTYFILGHLSPENNHPHVADNTTRDALDGYERGRDYLLGVAPMETKGGAVIF